MTDATYACILYEFLEGSSPDETDEKNVVRQFRNLGETTAYLQQAGQKVERGQAFKPLYLEL
jgi:Ser/Thr protein kinase RdoA (MazF antagonist)